MPTPPSNLRLRHFLFALLALAGPFLVPLSIQAADEPASAPRELFEKRIMPIFKSPEPSSCVQCHLAGVDLKDYILPSHEKTFLSLRDQGLVDLDNPDQSKILRLIQMGEKDTPEVALIHRSTRRAEYEAFSEWIRASARDPRLRNAPKQSAAELARPERPVEVIRHERKDRLLESFEQTIWAMRFRCMGCHEEGSPENLKHQKEHGPRVAWMKADGPEATMRYLIEKTDLLDTDSPERSMLLLKPLNEVKHEGGKKFLSGDLGYKAFRSWIEDYAAIAQDRYKRASDLPPSDSSAQRFGSDIWLKIAETPPEWGDKLLTAKVYAWNDSRKAWESEPIAISDRGVWGQGRLWQHNLVLLAPRDSARAKSWSIGKPSLPPGRYQLRAYVDLEDRARQDWRTPAETSFVGEAEFQSRWAAVYGRMTVVQTSQLRRP